MWYYNGARNKGVIKMLTSMQRKAALWITGAFRTSPTGGVEALAGLLPISHLLRRMADRAAARFVTLTKTHPLRALVTEEYHGDAPFFFFKSTIYIPVLDRSPAVLYTNECNNYLNTLRQGSGCDAAPKRD